MKNYKILMVVLLALLTASVARSECAVLPSVTVVGKIVDAHSKKGLANVNVSLKGTNVATVSNVDGRFSLHCRDCDGATRVTFTAVGYSAESIPLDSLVGNKNVIRMRRRGVELPEVVVYSGDAMKIVSEAMRKIPENYSLNNELLSVFYRETVRKGRRFIGVSEASVDVYKTPYDRRDISGDRVQIKRGRRLVSQRSSDTLAVKIVGGPNLAVVIDFVKNDEAIFTEAEMGDYDFRMERPEYIDDRLQYVVSFTPRVTHQYAMFQGRFYIDRELLAFTRAEFEVDPSDKRKMTDMILYKKPRGLRFSTQRISFVVSYKQVGGKTYLNYIQNVMRFKCEMKRKLFASAYETYSEMVVVDRDDSAPTKIAMRDAFKPHQVFYDMVDEYWDEGYWADYNIIEPTESLEHAVERLKKQNRK